MGANPKEPPVNARKLHKGKQRHAIARTSEAAQLRELRSELADALAQQAATMIED